MGMEGNEILFQLSTGALISSIHLMKSLFNNSRHFTLALPSLKIKANEVGSLEC